MEKGAVHARAGLKRRHPRRLRAFWERLDKHARTKVRKRLGPSRVRGRLAAGREPFSRAPCGLPPVEERMDLHKGFEDDEELSRMEDDEAGLGGDEIIETEEEEIILAEEEAAPEPPKPAPKPAKKKPAKRKPRKARKTAKKKAKAKPRKAAKKRKRR